MAPPGPDAARPTPIGLQHTTELVLERITTYLAQTARPEAWVVGVFGEWGSGKSTLLSEIARHFPNVPIERPDPKAPITLRVEFNAWRYEREEHLLVPLLRTIERTLEEYADAIEQLPIVEHLAPEPAALAALGIADASAEAAALAAAATVAARPEQRRERRNALARWIASKARIAGYCAAAMTKGIKLKAPLVGEIELTPAEAAKTYRELTAAEAKEKADAEAKDAEPAFDEQSVYYNLFAHLRRLTRADETPGEPRLNLVFLIDDLDRCLPEKAVEMLESIKLFLDVQGCVFVLAVDDEVVERGIAHRYRDYLDVTDRAAESIAYSLRPERYRAYLGRYALSRQAPITGSEYLEKIVQLAVRLPRFSRNQATDLLRQHAPDLFTPSAPAPGVEVSDWLLRLFLEAVPPVPRKLIRAADLLTFVRQLAERQGVLTKLQPYTLAQLSLLQVFAPQMFRYLSRRDRLHSWTRLDARLKAAQTEAGSDVYGASFFEWWEKAVEDGRKAFREKSADVPTGVTLTQLERYEEPFIAELRQACTGRSGFDPRNLFLPSLTVDPNLRLYINLLADEATTSTATTAPATAAPASTTPPPQPPPATTIPAATTAAAAPAAAAPGPAPPAAPPVSPPAASATPAATGPATAAPRELGNFVDLLLSPHEDSWHGALDSEPILQGRVLDRRAFIVLRDAITQRAFAITGRWMSVVGTVLSDSQAKELLVANTAMAAATSDDVLDALAAGELIDAACQKLRPWDTPVEGRLDAEEIGLPPGTDVTRREWAYRYRRGLIDDAVVEQEAVEIWRGYQPFTWAPVHSLREIRPGAVAVSTLSAFASVWSSAFRGQWARSGQLAASSSDGFRLTALGPFHVVGFSSSTVAIWHLQPFGHWQRIYEFALGGNIKDLAVLSQRRFVLMSGTGTLTPFRSPSRGRWEALPSPIVPHPLTGVAAIDPDRFLAVGSASLLGTFGDHGVTMTPVTPDGSPSSVSQTSRPGVVATFGSGLVRLQQIDDVGGFTTLASGPSMLGAARIVDSNGDLLLLRTDEAFEVWSTRDAKAQRLGEGPLPSAGDGVRVACLLRDGRVASASPFSGVQVLRPTVSGSTYEFDSNLGLHSPWTPMATASPEGAVLTHPAGALRLVAARTGDDELEVSLDTRLRSTRQSFVDVWPVGDTDVVLIDGHREGVIWNFTTGATTRFPIPARSVSAIANHAHGTYVAVGNAIVELIREDNGGWDTGPQVSVGPLSAIEGIASSRDGHLLAWQGTLAAVVPPGTGRASSTFTLPGPAWSVVPLPPTWLGGIGGGSLVLLATGQFMYVVDLAKRNFERWLESAGPIYAAAGFGTDGTLAFGADGSLQLFDGTELRVSHPALLHGFPARLQVVDDSTVLLQAGDDAWYAIAVRESGALRVMRMLITPDALVVQDLTVSSDATKRISPKVSTMIPLDPQLREMEIPMARRVTMGPFGEILSAVPAGEVARNLVALVRKSGELLEPSARPETISWRLSSGDESRALALTLRRP